jgi:ribosomal-protein-alanine N-acetyltransferase
MSEQTILDTLPLLVPKELKSDRLFLELPKLDHAEDIFDYSSNPNVTKYLTWETHSSIFDTIQFIKWAIDKNKTGKNMIWIISEKFSGKKI